MQPEHLTKTRSILRRACRGGIDLYADRQVFRNGAYFSTVPQWVRVPTSTPSSPVGSHYLKRSLICMTYLTERQPIRALCQSRFINSLSIVVTAPPTEKSAELSG